MISKVRIKNFKCMKELELDLTPLTIIFGPNGVGKSAFLDAITLLKENVEKDFSIDRHPGFRKFDEVVYGRDISKTISIGIWIKPTEEESEELVRLSKSLPEHFVLDSIEGLIGYEIEIKEGKIYRHNLYLDHNLYLQVGIEEEWLTPVILYPKLEKIRSEAELDRVLDGSCFKFSMPRKESEDFSERVTQYFKSRIGKIYEISCLRDAPSSAEPLKEKPEWVEYKGENLIEVLSFIFGPKGSKVTRERISRFAKDFEMPGLRAGWIGEKLEATYEDPSLHTKLNISVAGYGSRQILPVITQLFYCNPGSIVMVEEPETSLHPAAQAKLPYLFSEAINEGKQVILTTHSVFLPMAMGRAIKKGLKPEEIGVYEMEKDKNGTKPKPLRVTKDGYIKGWIPSFYSEEVKLIQEWTSTLSEAE